MFGLFSLCLVNPVFAQKPSPCVDCHQKSDPTLVKQYLEGTMGKAEIECSQCHGSEHRNATDYKKVRMPNADTCRPCHAKQVEQFKAGKHSLAWAAMTAIPFTARQPKEVIEKGCAGCHRVGYEGGKCDSCHTRHAFSKEEARNPRPAIPATWEKIIPSGRCGPHQSMEPSISLKGFGSGAQMPDLPHARRQPCRYDRVGIPGAQASGKGCGLDDRSHRDSKSSWNPRSQRETHATV